MVGCVRATLQKFSSWKKWKCFWCSLWNAGSVKQKSAKSNASPSRTPLLADHLIGKKALTLYTNLLETAIFVATPMKNNILQFILVVFFLSICWPKTCGFNVKIFSASRRYKQVSLNLIFLYCKIKMTNSIRFINERSHCLPSTSSKGIVPPSPPKYWGDFFLFSKV